MRSEEVMIYTKGHSDDACGPSSSVLRPTGVDAQVGGLTA
jgi:hypothetical protein